MKPALLLLASASLAVANTAPTVVIQSAAMREGTTYMDVVFRVNDPDDATVKTRALVFVDGVRSFSNVIKPVTFIEGTAANIGDNITTGVNHLLTWDIAIDWNIDLANVKFEVLAMDARGLLPFDWITIPAAGGNSEITISRDTVSDTKVMDAFFWQYASGDTSLVLNGGLLTAATTDGFNGTRLMSGTTSQSYALPYLLKKMNLQAAPSFDLGFANLARAGLVNTGSWHALQSTWTDINMITAWGSIQNTRSFAGIIQISKIDGEQNNFITMEGNGRVSLLSSNAGDLPDPLVEVSDVAAGENHFLLAKTDGTLVAFGNNTYGQSPPAAGLTGVTKVAAGRNFSLALTSDGNVFSWGQINQPPPAAQVDVIAIAAGQTHALALKLDGTVVGWGGGLGNPQNVPPGLTNVTAIAAGMTQSMALKDDGTVVCWGGNQAGESTPPPGLNDVVAIAAGSGFNRGVSVALKSDGTVVTWGQDAAGGPMDPPPGLSGISKIAVGRGLIMAVSSSAP
jgi:hypothetical protein